MRTPAIAACLLLLSGSVAHAAARAVLLPVVVGSGGEPPGNLMTALAQGLKDNPGWTVLEGNALKGLMVPPTGLKDEDRARLGAKLDEAAGKLAKAAGAKEAVADIEAVRTELGKIGRAHV